MHLLLRLTFLILSLKVLDSTSSDKKSAVCDNSITIAHLNDNIETILFSRTHNLSLKVNTNNIKNNTLLVISNELELHHDLETENATTAINLTTDSNVGASVDDRNQGSAKNNFKEDDNDHKETTTIERFNDTVQENGKLLQ